MDSQVPPDIIELRSALRDGVPLAPIVRAFGDPVGFALAGLLDRQLFLEGSKVHFDSVADHYLEQVVATFHMMESLRWQVRTLPELFEELLASVRRGEPILITDLGSGAGAVSSWPILHGLRHKNVLIKGASLTCFDVSPKMREVTSRLTIEGVPPQLRELFDPYTDAILSSVRSARYISEDFTSSDFIAERASPTSHLVVCSFALHHLSLQGKYEAGNCIRKMLRVGGIAIVLDEYRSLAENIQEMKHAEISSTPFALESFMEGRSYEALFERVGLHVRQHRVIAGGRTLCFVLQKI